MNLESYEFYKANIGVLFEVTTEKTPLLKGWREVQESIPFDENKIYGVRPFAGMCIIDVDVKNGSLGFASLLAIENDYMFDLNIGWEYNIETPSGGYHIFYRYDVDKYGQIIKNQKEFQGIDFLTDTSYALIGGNSGVISKDEIGNPIVGEYFVNHYNIECDNDLVENILNTKLIVENDTQTDMDNILKNRISVENLQTTLTYLDSNVRYDWVRYGMAIKRSGHDFELFHEWSENADSYQSEGDCLKIWNSFDGHDNTGIGIPTLIYDAMDIKFGEFLYELSSNLTQTKINDDFPIVPITDARIKQIEKTLVEGWELKHNEDIDPLIVSSYIDGLVNNGIEEIDNLDEYLFVDVNDEFKSIKTNQKVQQCTFENLIIVESNSSRYYDILNNRFITKEVASMMTRKARCYTTSKSIKIVPFGSAIDDKNISTVTHTMYHPQRGLFFTYKGTAYVNIFRESSISPTVEYINPLAMPYINAFEKHLYTLYDDQAKHLLAILGYIVQNVGTLSYVPILQGLQGVGKTMIGEILSNILGDVNVESINNSIVNDKYTGWIEGGIVKVIEEFRIDDNYKNTDVKNDIKNLITNYDTRVNPKYGKEKTVIITASIIGITNYRDAVKFENNDRRYYRFMSNINSTTHKNEMGDAYSLVGDLAKDGLYSSDMRTWLISKVYDGFSPKKIASQEGNESIRNEQIQDYDYDVMHDIISYYGSADIVNVSTVRDMFNQHFKDSESNKRYTNKIVKNMLMSSYGYQLINNRNTTLMCKDIDINIANDRAVNGRSISKEYTKDEVRFTTFVNNKTFPSS